MDLNDEQIKPDRADATSERNTSGIGPDTPSATKQPDTTPSWTYPTRMCRICYEDVVPTVTMYPPGLPPKLQRPHVEYKNDDEYGRLIRPCKCRGGMRYIHENCLLRSRTSGVRPNSLWKCHECGHQFNFQRLTIQRYLGSRISSGMLAVLFMLIVMFGLGFVADPLINLYVDPYDVVVGNEDYWREIDINASKDSVSGWSLHFLKGMISMGLVGFLKTALLNPFHWWNFRTTGWSSGRSTGTTTGRDRAVNISWVAVIIGISSAFYFFYQWTQKIIGKTLERIGNNIVDTQLPDDDEDIKPPPDFRYVPPEPPDDGERPKAKEPSLAEKILTGAFPLDAQLPAQTQRVPEALFTKSSLAETDHAAGLTNRTARQVSESDVSRSVPEQQTTASVQPAGTSETGATSALNSARDQGWSFVDIPR